jgi:hypothetical protein
MTMGAVRGTTNDIDAEPQFAAWARLAADRSRT